MASICGGAEHASLSAFEVCPVGTPSLESFPVERSMTALPEASAGRYPQSGHTLQGDMAAPGGAISGPQAKTGGRRGRETTRPRQTAESLHLRREWHA